LDVISIRSRHCVELGVVGFGCFGHDVRCVFGFSAISGILIQEEASTQRMGSRKPNTTEAMRQVIAEIRTRIPFDLPQARLCMGNCQGCSMKLLQFLDGELEAWERRLDGGERPGFEELSDLVRTARKVHRVLERNGLTGDQAPPPAGRS